MLMSRGLSQGQSWEGGVSPLQTQEKKMKDYDLLETAQINSPWNQILRYLSVASYSSILRCADVLCRYIGTILTSDFGYTCERE